MHNSNTEHNILFDSEFSFMKIYFLDARVTAETNHPKQLVYFDENKTCIFTNKNSMSLNLFCRMWSVQLPCSLYNEITCTIAYCNHNNTSIISIICLFSSRVDWMSVQCRLIAC